jgi:hypothetical protein
LSITAETQRAQRRNDFIFAVERTANIKDNLLEAGTNGVETECLYHQSYIPKGCCFTLSGLSTERVKKNFTSVLSASPW